MKNKPIANVIIDDKVIGQITDIEFKSINNKTNFKYDLIHLAEFDFCGMSFLIKEIPKDFYPSNMFPHSSSNNHDGICCIMPNGNTSIVFVKSGYYELIGKLDEVNEIYGIPFDLPKNFYSPNTNYALIRVLNEK